MDVKNEQYTDLINKRKTCMLCKSSSFINQSETNYDFDEIGNWTTWANNLNADVVIVGQDYADVFTFNKDKGKIEPKITLKNNSLKNEYSTVTNFYLRELTKIIGYDIGIPTETSNKKIFLTNSVLCLKEGSMSKSIPQSVYKSCGLNFLKPTIEIVKPKVIITLGATATKSVISAYSETIDNSKELLRSSFATIFNTGNINIIGANMIVVPVYHTGKLGQNNRKKLNSDANNGFDLMKEDWNKVKEILNS